MSDRLTEPEEFYPGFTELLGVEYRAGLRRISVQPERLAGLLALVLFFVAANLAAYGYFANSVHRPLYSFGNLVTLTVPWFHHFGSTRIVVMCLFTLAIALALPLFNNQRPLLRLTFALLLAGALVNTASTFIWSQGVPDFIAIPPLTISKTLVINTGDICILVGAVASSFGVYRLWSDA